MTPMSASGALGAAASDAQSELNRLLSERSKLRALVELGGPSAQNDARSALATIDAQIGGLLERWQRAGGRVNLDTLPANHSATPRRRTVSGAVPVTRHRRAYSSTIGSGVGPTPSTAGPTTTRSGFRPDLREVHAVDPQWRDTFSQFLGRLGPGQDLAGEIDIVTAAAVACEDWSRWPRHVQRHLVGLLACRLRGLQDEQGVPEPELQEGFSALTRFSKRAKPGFVFGLSRSHRPQHGPSWDHDAVKHWDHLAALTAPGVSLSEDQQALLDRLVFLTSELGSAPEAAYEMLRKQALRVLSETLEAGVDARLPDLVAAASALHPIPNTRAFLRLRRALRDAASAEHDSGAGLPIEPDWRWGQHTRQRRGLILGERPADESLDILEQAFGMSGLSWQADEDAKRHLVAGDVGVVFVFGRHLSDTQVNELLPLAHARKIPTIHVDHGTSVARVRSAIERYTEPEGEATL